jgi:hypothetical protein
MFKLVFVFRIFTHLSTVVLADEWLHFRSHHNTTGTRYTPLFFFLSLHCHGTSCYLRSRFFFRKTALYYLELTDIRCCSLLLLLLQHHPILKKDESYEIFGGATSSHDQPWNRKN